LHPSPGPPGQDAQEAEQATNVSRLRALAGCLMQRRSRLANAIRGDMAEYGIVAPNGWEGASSS
jgi:hypothetical protein